MPVAGEDGAADRGARLAAAGIGVTELSLHLPSLDEVFLDPDRPARPTNDEEVAA